MSSRILDNQTKGQADDFPERLADLWERMQETDGIEETAGLLQDVSTAKTTDQPQSLTGVDTPEGAAESERRRSERHGYASVQKLAPCTTSAWPEEQGFRNARFHDISRGGASFFWPEPPDFEYVVVLLGDGQDTISLMARVVRHQPIPGLQNEYLVCCEFMNRVNDQ